MNVISFGSQADPSNKDIEKSDEHTENYVDIHEVESLTQGDEYLDDAIRMTDQAFNQS